MSEWITNWVNVSRMYFSMYVENQTNWTESELDFIPVIYHFHSNPYRSEIEEMKLVTGPNSLALHYITLLYIPLLILYEDERECVISNWCVSLSLVGRWVGLNREKSEVASDSLTLTKASYTLTLHWSLFTGISWSWFQYENQTKPILGNRACNREKVIFSDIIPFPVFSSVSSSASTPIFFVIRIKCIMHAFAPQLQPSQTTNNNISKKRLFFFTQFYFLLLPGFIPYIRK